MMNLTLEQRFKIEQIKREIPSLSQEKIKNCLLLLIEQMYFYKNVCIELKKKSSIDEIGQEKSCYTYYSNIF